MVVTLSNPSFGSFGGAATGTIEDDDPVPVFSLTGSGSAREDGVLEFTVVRAFDAQNPQTVTFTASNAGTGAGFAAASDYTAASGTLTFNQGELTKTFTIAPIDDTIQEGNEVFNVALSNPTGGAVVGGITSAQGTIIDNDVASFIVSDASADENTAAIAFHGIAHARFPLDQVVHFDALVGAGDNATAGTDFTTVSQALTFTPGELSKTVVVPVTPDAIFELPERFTVTF